MVNMKTMKTTRDAFPCRAGKTTLGRREWITTKKASLERDVAVCDGMQPCWKLRGGTSPTLQLSRARRRNAVRTAVAAALSLKERGVSRTSAAKQATATGRSDMKKHVLKITAKKKKARAREEHAVGAL
jgi:hypothetical protein